RRALREEGSQILGLVARGRTLVDVTGRTRLMRLGSLGLSQNLVAQRLLGGDGVLDGLAALNSLQHALTGTLAQLRVESRLNDLSTVNLALALSRRLRSQGRDQRSHLLSESIELLLKFLFHRIFLLRNVDGNVLSFASNLNCILCVQCYHSVIDSIRDSVVSAVHIDIGFGLSEVRHPDVLVVELVHSGVKSLLLVAVGELLSGPVSLKNALHLAATASRSNQVNGLVRVIRIKRLNNVRLDAINLALSEFTGHEDRRTDGVLVLLNKLHPLGTALVLGIERGLSLFILSHASVGIQLAGDLVDVASRVQLLHRGVVRVGQGALGEHSRAVVLQEFPAVVARGPVTLVDDLQEEDTPPLGLDLALCGLDNSLLSHCHSFP